MSEPKRYYWLQLSVDFFNSIEIKLLRKIAGGDTYTIIYLKMLLASLKDEGKMYFEGVADDIYEEVALLIDEDIENVKVTMIFLEQKGLIEIHESDEYFLNQVPSMIGSETSSASRMRRLRANKKKEELLQSDVEASQCDKNVTEKCNIVHESDDIKSKRRYRDKVDNNILSDSDKSDDIHYQEIVEYLNQKTGSNYKPTTGKTKSLIKTRYNEGFNLDDFKTVIDIKTQEWINDKDMSKYLRPETLFGTKFESYLNQPKKNNNKPQTVDELFKGIFDEYDKQYQ